MLKILGSTYSKLDNSSDHPPLHPSHREGSPIKRRSVEENTSPGEAMIIVTLLRYGPVAYLLRVCRYVSQVVSSDLRCGSSSTAHSPEAVTGTNPLTSLSPGGHVALL